MVTVQLIDKSTFLVRGKLVQQTDARGLPCTTTVGPWPSLHPLAAVGQQVWEPDGPAVPAPSTSCPPGTCQWSRRGGWSPVRAAGPQPASPGAAGRALGYQCIRISSPVIRPVYYLLFHPSWWSFPSFPSTPSSAPFLS